MPRSTSSNGIVLSQETWFIVGRLTESGCAGPPCDAYPSASREQSLDWPVSAHYDDEH